MKPTRNKGLEGYRFWGNTGICDARCYESDADPFFIVLKTEFASKTNVRVFAIIVFVRPAFMGGCFRVLTSFGIV